MNVQCRKVVSSCSPHPYTTKSTTILTTTHPQSPYNEVYLVHLFPVSNLIFLYKLASSLSFKLSDRSGNVYPVRLSLRCVCVEMLLLLWVFRVVLS